MNAYLYGQFPTPKPVYIHLLHSYFSLGAAFKITLLLWIKVLATLNIVYYTNAFLLATF